MDPKATSKRRGGATVRALAIAAAVAIAMLAGTAVHRVEARRSPQTPRKYHVVDLGTLGGSFSSAFGINASGQISGTSDSPSGVRAFFWNGTVMQDLGTLGGNSSGAGGLNDAGHVVGTSATANFGNHAFVWNGVMRDLGTCYTGCVSINNADQIVGSLSSFQGVIWDPIAPQGGGPIQQWSQRILPPLQTVNPDGCQGVNSGAAAIGINDDGIVVGYSVYTKVPRAGTPCQRDVYHGVVWSGGSATDLGTLFGDHTLAGAISRTGVIVGSSSKVPVGVADAALWPFVWQGGMVDIGTLGGDDGTARGVNAAGEVVGYARIPGNTAYHGFLWNGSITDLNSMLDAASAGWTITRAAGINDKHQIAAEATKPGVGSRAVRLDPVYDIDLRLEIEGFPAAAYLDIQNQNALPLTVRCVRTDGGPPPASCLWNINIDVAAQDLESGGHLAAANPDVHSPDCREIGSLFPALAGVVSVCGGSAIVMSHSTSSAAVGVNGLFWYSLPVRAVLGGYHAGVWPIASRVTFTATCGEPNCADAVRTLDLKVPNLVPVADTTRLTVRGKSVAAGHLNNQYATDDFRFLLNGVADKFNDLLNKTSLSSFKKPRLVVTDLSLKWGGVFDVGGNGVPAGTWMPPHAQHSRGIAADLRSNYKPRCDPSQQVCAPNQPQCDSDQQGGCLAPEPASDLSDDEAHLVNRKLAAALMSLGTLVKKFPAGEGPQSCPPPKKAWDCVTHFHLELAAPLSRFTFRPRRLTQTLPLPQATVAGAATPLGGGLSSYDYVLQVPSASGSAIDSWSIRVGGTISNVTVPPGWIVSTTSIGTATAIVFAANGSDVDADGVDLNGVQPGQALAGFSFVSNAGPATVPFVATGYVPMDQVWTEAEAEQLALEDAPVGEVTGNTLGPSPTLSGLLITPSALTFHGVRLAGSAVATVGAGQVVNVGFSGAVPNWTVTADRLWLQLTLSVGIGAGQFVATVLPALLTNGVDTDTATITVSAPGADPVEIPVEVSITTELVQNGSFGAGLSGWLTFATPDASYIESNVTGGVLQLRRIAQAAGQPTNQAVAFQQTHVPLPAGATATAAFDLANTSDSRKMMRVLLVADPAFTDLAACTFWLEPHAPMRSYQMRSFTTKDWTDAAIYFYASTAKTDSGNYQVDNVSFQYTPGLSTERTDCIDPTTPTPVVGPDGPDLLVNGDFGTNQISPWFTFGTITVRNPIVGGVLEYIRPNSTFPQGVVLQPTGQPMTAGQIMTATFRLGNNSSVRKRALVIVHDNDFSDMVACSFWMQPGQPIGDYAMKFFASKAWTNATAAVYANTIGPEQWTQLDAFTLQRTPSATTVGSECVEGSEAVGLRARAAIAPPSSMASPAGAPSIVGSGDLPGSSDPTWVETDDGWEAVAPEIGESILELEEPLDLAPTDDARLVFDSWLSSVQSRAEVQVSANGGDWSLAATVAPSDGWQPVEIELAEYAGQLVHVRFVLRGAASTAAGSEHWRIRSVRVESASGMESQISVTPGP